MENWTLARWVILPRFSFFFLSSLIHATYLVCLFAWRCRHTKRCRSDVQQGENHNLYTHKKMCQGTHCIVPRDHNISKHKKMCQAGCISHCVSWFYPCYNTYMMALQHVPTTCSFVCQHLKWYYKGLAKLGRVEVWIARELKQPRRGRRG